MNGKNRRNPLRDDSLRSGLVMPAFMVLGLLLIALVLPFLGDGFSGGRVPTGALAVGGGLLNDEAMQRFVDEWDDLGVSMGSPGARLVVREFAGVTCPHCQDFAPTAERLRDEYLISGQVRFVIFVDPLSLQDHARRAAAAARCAARQQAYWAYQDRLFANRHRWAASADPTPEFLHLALQEGIQIEPFKRCLAHSAAEGIVAKNAEIARTLGVASIPTVLVGRRVFSGGTTYDALATEIETQLAAAGPR